MGGTFFRGARTVGGRPCRMRPTVNCGVPSSWGLATCRRAWRRRQGGCGWLLWTRQRRVGVSAASLDGPRTSTTQWATARHRSTARSGRRLGRRKACGRAHFWPRGAEYASTRMVPRGGDAGRSVVDAQRGRLSSCWLCQLTALDLGGGFALTRRGVGEWAGRSSDKRAKDVRRPWRSAHPCRRSGDVYSRGRVLWCNLLPWGRWYGEWEQDDDRAKATLEGWVMGVRSRRRGLKLELLR